MEGNKEEKEMMRVLDRGTDNEKNLRQRGIFN